MLEWVQTAIWRPTPIYTHKSLDKQLYMVYDVLNAESPRQPIPIGRQV